MFDNLTPQQWQALDVRLQRACRRYAYTTAAMRTTDPDFESMIDAWDEAARLVAELHGL